MEVSAAWSTKSEMDEAMKSKMVKLFDIAYNLAKNELPFTLFPKLIKMERRHGVELGNAYHNPIQAHTFTGFIADDLRSHSKQLFNQKQ